MKHFRKLIGLLLSATMFCGLFTTASAAPASQQGASSCVITGEDTITFTGGLPSLPASDDGTLYLFELACFENSVAGKTAIATAPLSSTPVFEYSLTNSSGRTRLYSKFAMAVKQGGSYTMIGQPQYITNPEALATHTKEITNHPLKGEQGTTFLNLWMSGTPSEGIARSLPRTVQLMNTGVNPVITNPYAKVKDSHYTKPWYYMLNANDQAGVDAIAAEISYYAANSNAEIFIVGNEVNVRSWNYMAWQGWDAYVQQYAQVFRVAYNAIKSQNANAQVLICLDSQWDRNRPTGHSEYYQYMDGKDFLFAFNNLMRAGGNVDWGVSIHPHTCPLTNAKFWNKGAYYATQINTNKMVSFENLSIVTNTMQAGELLSPSGAVRYFTISEMGLTNAQGADVQAAAVAASYAAAKRNPYVKEIIYLTTPQPDVDFTLIGRARDVYNALGGPDEESYMNWAKAYIGISDWGQALR